MRGTEFPEMNIAGVQARHKGTNQEDHYTARAGIVEEIRSRMSAEPEDFETWKRVETEETQTNGKCRGSLVVWSK